MDLGITTYSSITKKGAFKEGKPVYNSQGNIPFAVYSKEIYSVINPSYPKFFKMDELSKLAFLATEVLLSEKPFDNGTHGEDIAVVLGNRNSSITSDKKHFESFHNREDYFPSPAVFVYTLPNIMLGEICIRHGINGENTCFLMDKFDAAFLSQYVQSLFEKEQYQYCLTGWVDYTEEDYNAHLFLVEKWKKDINFIKKFDANFDKINTNGKLKG